MYRLHGVPMGGQGRIEEPPKTVNFIEDVQAQSLHFLLFEGFMDKLPLTRQTMIKIIRTSKDWSRVRVETVSIKNIDCKDIIRKQYPNTDMKNWEKEYTTWMHRKTGFKIEIHRFVNRRNKSQECCVKIKKTEE